MFSILCRYLFNFFYTLFLFCLLFNNNNFIVCIYIYLYTIYINIYMYLYGCVFIKQRSWFNVFINVYYYNDTIFMKWDITKKKIKVKSILKAEKNFSIKKKYIFFIFNIIINYIINLRYNNNIIITFLNNYMDIENV